MAACLTLTLTLVFDRDKIETKKVVKEPLYL